jgi:hypothetical protein
MRKHRTFPFAVEILIARDLSRTRAVHSGYYLWGLCLSRPLRPRHDAWAFPRRPVGQPRLRPPARSVLTGHRGPRRGDYGLIQAPDRFPRVKQEPAGGRRVIRQEAAQPRPSGNGGPMPHAKSSWPLVMACALPVAGGMGSTAPLSRQRRARDGPRWTLLDQHGEAVRRLAFTMSKVVRPPTGAAPGTNESS